MGYPGEGSVGSSWDGWLLGLIPSGYPGGRIDRAFLGQLAFGPSPFKALGLGRLARGTGPGPMVPTYAYYKFIVLYEAFIFEINLI